MLDVCLLGSGGMMPLPKRWLTSLMLRLNGSSMLIDCGEGTQVAIREKGWSFHPIDVICVTHFHGDHVSGLPGLLLSMGNADRTDPVTIVGPKGLQKVVGALRVIAPELPFPIEFIEIAEPSAHLELNGFSIDAFKVNHNIACYGYSVSVPRAGKFQPEKAERNRVPKAAWSRLQKGEVVEMDGKTYTQDMILGPPRKGIKVTYCTDTRPCGSIVEFARGADLFVCEGMYGERDKEAKAREHKHMTFYEAAGLAKEAKVRQMWLTHYSPSLARPELYLKDTRKIFENVWLGRDGKSVTLQFEQEGKDGESGTG